MTVDAQIVVTDAPKRRRFEVTVDGEPAGSLVYRLRPGLLALIHTEVDERFEGHGLGSRLARFALEQARAQGLEVLPFCPFVNDWMKRHPEFNDLVPAGYRASFDLSGTDVAFARPAPTHSRRRRHGGATNEEVTR